MNKSNQRAYFRMKRVKQHCEDNLPSPTNPAVTVEATGLGTVIIAYEAAGVTQDGGAGTIASAVENRRTVAKQLRILLRSLAKVARGLDPITHPEVAGKMRMANTHSFAKLLTRAVLFKETLAPIKELFVDLGAPADVDQELDALIEGMQGEGGRKNSGLGTRVGGTHNLKAKARAGIRHMQKLDAIFTQLYRKDPVKLAQWKVANRATPYSSESAVPAAPAAAAPTVPATAPQ